MIMPMDFPDLESLIRAAEVHKFRPPKEGEPERIYRGLLANHVESRDFIEAQEIRNGVGWDKFDNNMNRDMVNRLLR
jgi:hypothetical protein